MVAIKCPSCSNELRPENVNIQAAIGTCSSCHKVFALSGNTRPKLEVQLPAHFTTTTRGADLVIQRRWFTYSVIFLTFFTLIWDAFIVSWYAMSAVTNAPAAVKYFPIIHVAIGVLLTYFTIATWINKTVIQVSSQSLRINHGPLPWPGNHNIAPDQIKQLFCHEHVARGKRGPTATYEVHAVLQNDHRVKLLAALPNPEQALYIEQQIESYLGIQDQAVTGEFRS